MVSQIQPTDVLESIKIAFNNLVKQQAAVSRLGQLALTDISLQELFDLTCNLVTKTLEVPYTRILQYNSLDKNFIPISSTGWPKTRTKIPSGENSHAGYAYMTKKPIVVSDFKNEKRFVPYWNVSKVTIRSGLTIVIKSKGQAFGILSAHSKQAGYFTKDDVYFIQSVANILAAAIYRKHSEEQIRESEELNRTLINLAPDIVYRVSRDENLTALSPAFEKITGWTIGESLNKPFKVLVHPEDLIIAHNKFQLGLKDFVTDPYYLRLITKSKNYIIGEFRSVPQLKGGKVIGKIGIIRDVTERRQKEEEQAFQKTLLELQNEASTDGILVVSTDGKIISYNDRLLTLWNISKDNVENTSWQKLYKLIATKLADSELFLKRVKDLENSLEMESNWEIFLKDERFFNFYTKPIRNKDGVYYGRIWFFRNITKQKREEQQRDNFLGIASHELKTPLASIKAFTQILFKVHFEKNDPKTVRYLAKIDGQVNKLTALINDLLDVSKLRAGSPDFKHELFEFDDLLAETIETIQDIYETHKIGVYGKTDKKIYGDRNRIFQVLTNLITNAIKYSPQADRIIIRVKEKDKYINLAVQDFGIGIPKKDQQNVFKLFYRVREKFSEDFPGFGFGLYIASEIVKLHKGRIWLNSEKNRGTTFHISLPIASNVR